MMSLAMLPLRDDVPSRTFPFFNLALIGANAYVFWLELAAGRRLDAFVRHWALIPSVWLVRPAPETLVTSMFLHGGWFHLVSNLWVLYIFGDNVEDKLGHFRYLLFYLLCGAAAGTLQLATHWGSALPTLGASGAIAGVMGAYFMLFPGAKVTTLVPLFFLPVFVDVSAFVFLGLWFVSQIYSGVHSAGTRYGGIAWWAHVGGFIAGAALIGRWLPGSGRRRR